MWDHSSPSRGQTRAPAVEAQSVNHWATEAPLSFYLDSFIQKHFR